MSKLDSLRIKEYPAAFAELAAKHNALVDLLANAEGANGLKVTVSDNNIKVGIEGALTVPALTVTGNLNVGGDAFFTYVECSGDIYADGTLFMQGFELNAATYTVCDGGSAVSKDFIIRA